MFFFKLNPVLKQDKFSFLTRAKKPQNVVHKIGLAQSLNRNVQLYQPGSESKTLGYISLSTTAIKKLLFSASEYNNKTVQIKETNTETRE
jgi:hypothetical protein